jgi:hypothetical protein
VFTHSVEGCSNIQDFSSLGSQHTLNVSRTNISDVSHLGYVTNLRIEKCLHVRDISRLGMADHDQLISATNSYMITNWWLITGRCILNLSWSIDDNETTRDLMRNMHSIGIYVVSHFGLDEWAGQWIYPGGAVDDDDDPYDDDDDDTFVINLDLDLDSGPETQESYHADEHMSPEYGGDEP